MDEGREIGRRINTLANAVKDLEGYDAAKGEIGAALEGMRRFLASDQGTRQKAARSLRNALRNEPSLARMQIGRDLAALALAYGRFAS